MNDTSPDASNDASTSDVTDPGLSRLRWILAGALMGASIPIMLAVYLFLQFSAYTATLPPGTAVCGTPLIIPWALLVIVAPIMGLMGGGASLLLVVNKQRKS